MIDQSDLNNMNKPLLVVITGRPASGKTTLAHILSKDIKLPLLSRDEPKEGYINAMGVHHNNVGNSVDWHIYETFFQTINLLISQGVSLIIEAAFQHKLWKYRLPDFLEKADVRIIVCEINPALAKMRFTNRLSNDPNREKFHEDKSDEKLASLIEAYERINIDTPMLAVDTSDNYYPGLEKIVSFIKQKNSC